MLVDDEPKGESVRVCWGVRRRWRSGAVDKQSYPVQEVNFTEAPTQSTALDKINQHKSSSLLCFVGQFGQHGSHQWGLCYCWSLLTMKTGCDRLIGALRWTSGCRGTRIHFGQQHSQSSVRAITAVSVWETATRGQEWLCSSSVISGNVSLNAFQSVCWICVILLLLPAQWLWFRRLYRRQFQIFCK